MKRYRVAIMLAAVCTLCLFQPVPGIAAENSAKEIVASKCVYCHSMKRICRAVGTRDTAGWNATVSRMTAKGLKLSKEQQKALVEHLVEAKTVKSGFCEK